MLNSKELRVKAWNSLKGKYWMAFGVVLVLGLLSSVGTSIASLSTIADKFEAAEMNYEMLLDSLKITGASLVIFIIGLIISIFMNTATEVGLADYFIKNTESKPSFKDAFSGFSGKYGRNIATLLLVSIKTALWTFLFVIPGIIKSYEYAIIPYILADDPEISSKDAFKKANQMMKGNKWRLFKLEFSFIGWFLLCILTLGIGIFFLIPYVNAANAEFYADLKNNQ